jgi:hypothetical protein
MAAGNDSSNELKRRGRGEDKYWSGRHGDDDIDGERSGPGKDDHDSHGSWKGDNKVRASLRMFIRLFFKTNIKI